MTKENIVKKHYGAHELRDLLGARVLVNSTSEHEGKKGTIVSVRLTESGAYKKPLYVQFDMVKGVSEKIDLDMSEVKILNNIKLFAYINSVGQVVKLVKDMSLDELAKFGMMRVAELDEVIEG